MGRAGQAVAKKSLGRGIVNAGLQSSPLHIGIRAWGRLTIGQLLLRGT